MDVGLAWWGWVQRGGGGVRLFNALRLLLGTCLMGTIVDTSTVGNCWSVRLAEAWVVCGESETVCVWIGDVSSRGAVTQV